MRCHIIIIITLIDHIHSCDDCSSVPEGAWHSALQNQQLWFLHQFSPSTGLWLRGSGEVPGRLCWSCLQARHGSLWLMDVVRQDISLCFTLARQSVDQRDIETRLSDASLGAWGPYRSRLHSTSDLHKTFYYFEQKIDK